MSTQNLVAVEIPAEVQQEVTTKINEVVDALSPYLIAISPDQRRELPKMGDGTQPFVEKALEYGKTNPQFVPPFVNVADLEIDYNATKMLLAFFRPLAQLMSKLDDTILLSGSEAYVAALSIYNTLKLAAKNNVPGAKSILEDLKKRFEGRSKRSNGNGSVE